jgi:PPOX class probable F420-dependent enzyme
MRGELHPVLRSTESPGPCRDLTRARLTPNEVGHAPAAAEPAAAQGPTGYGENVPIELPESAKDLIRSGPLGHLVTIDPDGSPQVTCVWVGVDGSSLLTAHLMTTQRKLANVGRDSRVAISFEGTEVQPPGLRQYLVVYGRAAIEEGGAADLLQELARTYLGPEVKFPPMDDPPPGVRMRIEVDRIGGVGPWAR